MKCSFSGCERKHFAKGLCKQHDKQRRRGFVLKPLGVPRPRRPLIENSDRPGTMLVPLTRGYAAIVDAADAAFVGLHNWSARVRRGGRSVYATRTQRDGKRSRPISLHQELWRSWGNAPCDEIDHKNGNSLDNTRLNLRAATTAQNQHNVGLRRDNKTGYPGVNWNRHTSKWVARITTHGRSRHIGSFDSLAAAGAARAQAERSDRGEFARPR